MSSVPARRVELLKNSATIHIANPLTINERKLYNILLFIARPMMRRGVDHEVDTDELIEMMGDRKLTRHYIATLGASLRQTTVIYNILGKDRKNADIWRMNAGLLAEFGFTEGVRRCKFSFPNTLVDLLASPDVYARINLEVQQRFKGHYSLPLYEFYVDFLGSKRGSAELTLSIDDLRSLLSISEETEYKIMRRDMILPAHKEISTKSDITVEIDGTIRKGRKIDQLKITISRKAVASGPPALVMKGQGSAADLLLELNIDTVVAEGLLAEFGDERVVRNVQYVKDRKGDVTRSVTGYVIQAIKQDYAANSESLPRKQRNAPHPRPQKQSANSEAKSAHSAANDDDVIDALSETEISRLREVFEKSDAYKALATPFGGNLKPSKMLYRGAFRSFVLNQIKK